MKYWTVAPDLQLTAEGFGSEHFAPGYQEKVFSGYLDYIVLHNMLNAIATISNVYKKEYKDKQQGTWVHEATHHYINKTRDIEIFFNKKNKIILNISG